MYKCNINIKQKQKNSAVIKLKLFIYTKKLFLLFRVYLQLCNFIKWNLNQTLFHVVLMVVKTQSLSQA